MAHLDYISQAGKTCYYGHYPTIKLAKLMGRFLIRQGRAIKFSIREA